MAAYAHAPGRCWTQERPDDAADAAGGYSLYLINPNSAYDSTQENPVSVNLEGMEGGATPPEATTQDVTTTQDTTTLQRSSRTSAPTRRQHSLRLQPIAPQHEPNHWTNPPPLMPPPEETPEEDIGTHDDTSTHNPTDNQAQEEDNTEGTESNSDIYTSMEDTDINYDREERGFLLEQSWAYFFKQERKEAQRCFIADKQPQHIMASTRRTRVSRTASLTAPRAREKADTEPRTPMDPQDGTTDDTTDGTTRRTRVPRTESLTAPHAREKADTEPRTPMDPQDGTTDDTKDGASRAEGSDAQRPPELGGLEV